jgi:hypothetical protein
MPRGEANRPAMPAFSFGAEIAEATMALPVEDPKLRRAALVYVIRLYDELTEENGAPTLGTQNQAVDFILADPELCRAVEAWGRTANIDEATTAPPQRLPQDALYDRVTAFMKRITEPPVFVAGLPDRR